MGKTCETLRISLIYKGFPGKKVLSLVLCVAVMLSVMVLGAGAAFSDQDQIENTEAVDATTALNIIAGYEDGSFHPERNIKRSEMCKMICIALNGGKEPATSTKDQPTFSDIDGHWAEGYIEYCYAQGVVSGVGGGRFNPDGNVTVTQAAKMLLVALGYNADVEQFNGGNWSLYVNVKANQDGIYEGLETIDTAAALTRDQAAQMIWNTMQAVVIVKTSTIDVTTGDVTETYSKDKENATLLNNKYKTNINVGTLISVDGKNLGLQMSGADEVDSDNKDVKDFMDVSVDYSALLGQKVKVMFTKSNDVQGVFATDENTVYTVNANAVDQDGDKIKFNDKSYSVELKGLDGNPGDGTTALVSYRDGDRIDGYTVAELAAMDTSASVLTLIDSDSNGKIDTVMEKTYTVAKVTYATSSQVVAGGTTYKTADHNVAEGLAKDDWVVITENLYDDCKDVVKADKIETTIGGYKDKTADGYHQYMVDGTWYNTADAKKLDADAGNKATIVVYNGIIFFADKVSGSTGDLDLALVVEKGNFAQAKLAFFDGTTKTVTIDDDSVDGWDEGNVYVYEISGDAYKLTALNATNLDNDDYTIVTTANAVIKSDATTDWASSATPKLIGTTGTTETNNVAIDDTAKVLLYTTDNKSKYITGKQFKTIKYSDLDSPADVVAEAALTSKVDGLTKVSYLAVNIGDAQPDEFQTNDNYAVVVSDSYKVDSDYIAYDIFDGENTIPVTEKKSSATREKGNIIGYSSIDENKVISDVTLYTEGSANAISNTANEYAVGAIQGMNAKGDTITIDGTHTFNITSDTKVILVDSDAENGKDEFAGVAGNSISSSNEADEIANTGLYYYNCAYILDGARSSENEADLAVLVVDVKNRLYNTLEGTVTMTAPTADSTNFSALKMSVNGVDVSGSSTPVAKGQVIVLSGTAAQSAKLTLTGAKFSDGTTVKNAIAAGDFSYEIYADGTGAVSVTQATAD